MFCQPGKMVSLIINFVTDLIEKPKEIICGKFSTDTKCNFVFATHICTKKVLV